MITTNFNSFWIVSVVVFISFATRFVYLGDIPGPVFDEIYYPMYGLKYLTDENFFYAHPPLGNYLYSVAIWIYYQLPWAETAPIQALSFAELDPLSYRWLNALFGSFMCVLAYVLAHAISGNKKFALIVCFFVAIDGSLLVDSRYGLINIYLAFFGLCALLCMAKSQYSDANRRYWLFTCGVFLGLSASIKWNGLGYLLVIISLVTVVSFVRTFDGFRSSAQKREPGDLQNIRIQNVIPSWDHIIYFLVTPLLVYVLIWIPDLRFNTEFNFFEKHQQMIGYHQNIVAEHPYCSRWYSWPFMTRPVSYFFSARDSVDNLGNEIMLFRDVHLFPNPAVYWSSVIAIVLMGIEWFKSLWQWFSNGIISQKFYIFTFILLGYFANLLPWALISRCGFLYHYQPAAIFGFFALAWYLTHFIKSESFKYRILCWTTHTLIVISFFYWFPIQFGITLESNDFYERMWFRSWI